VSERRMDGGYHKAVLASGKVEGASESARIEVEADSRLIRSTTHAKPKRDVGEMW
jgi:hypothetical protein